MGMCPLLAVEDKRIMPQNKIPDNIVTTLPRSNVSIGSSHSFKSVELGLPDNSNPTGGEGEQP